nr:MAG TPA_asm: 60S ribosome biogenesis protein [Caudoviricetes sp.]
MLLKIQFFDEIIYNIPAKIYIRLYEGIKFCTFSPKLFGD